MPVTAREAGQPAALIQCMVPRFWPFTRVRTALGAGHRPGALLCTAPEGAWHFSWHEFIELIFRACRGPAPPQVLGPSAQLDVGWGSRARPRRGGKGRGRGGRAHHGRGGERSLGPRPGVAVGVSDRGDSPRGHWAEDGNTTPVLEPPFLALLSVGG